MIAPGAMLGLLGGGQLGRMFTAAAHTLGYRVTVLDPDPASVAGAAADRHLCVDYTDSGALEELAVSCAAVTTEFESVPAVALARLAERCVVRPGADAVAIAQDRVREKCFLRDGGFAPAPFAVIESAADCARFDDDLLPGLLKVARCGYDGKGQAAVASREAVHAAFERFGAVPCVLERRIAFECEISVVIARGADGRTMHYPIAENRHRDGILDVSVVPAAVSPAIAQEAAARAMAIAERLDYVGVLAVEFFVTATGGLLVNEVAPRPHNSGHYTLDASLCSQFEQQVRALCGLPLGDGTTQGPIAMVNLLGDLWQPGAPDWSRVLAHPRAKLHLYGKDTPRAGRKMGHLTVRGGRAEDVVAEALALRDSVTAVGGGAHESVRRAGT